MNTDTPFAESVERLIKLGEEKPKSVTIKDEEHYLIPSGMKLETFRHLDEKPRRIDEGHTFTSPSSFIEYFNRFANQDSVILINRSEPSMTAIFDYHESSEEGKANEPRWGDHTAKLELQLSQEWKDWKELNDEFQSQEAFALFVEDNSKCFVEPDSATMMEVALEIQAKSGVEFEQSKRLSNGATSFVYREEINATAKGQMEIPSDLKIGLKVFEGITEVGEDSKTDIPKTVRYELLGKFRFSIRQKQLNLKYKLINMDTVYDFAVDKLVEYVGGNIKLGHVYEAKR